MFAWPNLELTDYEKKFVRVYGDGKYPGVLRRVYELFFNTVADPLTPGLDQIVTSGKIQIARRSRVFGLQFGGNLGSWRLNISTASGEQFTPRQTGADGPPVVSSMISGSYWNQLSSLKDQFVANAALPPNGPTNLMGSTQMGALLIDPNWVLKPNEILQFEGTPLPNVGTVPVGNNQKLLSIVVHVWEFPNMDGRTKRMGAGPQLKG